MTTTVRIPEVMQLSTDPELAAVVSAWPSLPSVVKTGILAMVKATHGKVAPVVGER